MKKSLAGALVAAATLVGATGAMATSFGGAYVGAAVDYGTTELGTVKTIILPPPPVDEVSSSVSGFGATAFAGYNHFVGHGMMVGLEADATWSDWNGTFHNDDYSVRWNASVRGRLGYLMKPDLLAYVTGGIGWMDGKISPNHVGEFSHTFTGFVVGAGIEYAIHPAARLRLEYLYSNYGSWTFEPNPALREKIDPEMHQFRIGLVIPLHHADERRPLK